MIDPNSSLEPPSQPSLIAIGRLFLTMGVAGFGGPMAHIALMQQRLVERERWLNSGEFASALAVTNLIPGPNSTEMAIHLGYLRAGRRTGLLAGLLFILPAFLMMLVLSWAYFRYDDIAVLEDLFSGVKPVVPAIVLLAAWALARRSFAEPSLWVIGGLAFIGTLLLPIGEPVYLLAAGAVTYFPSRPRGTASSSALALAPPLLLASAATYGKITWVFLKAGLLMFGGGYLLIPLIQDDVVNGYGWLSDEEFLDGIALGQSTPGPIIITATFVGYAAAGWWGAVLATFVIFLPSFLLVLYGTAPFMRRFKDSKGLRAFLKGTGAAAVGAIAAAGMLLLFDAVVNRWALALFALALVIAWRFKVDSVYLILAGGALGLLAAPL